MTAFLVASTGTAAFGEPRDGLHLLPDVWNGGCAVGYSTDARFEAEYGPNAGNAFAAISAVTGISFTHVGEGDSRAAIRFSVVEGLSGSEAGLASSDGSIQIVPAARLPQGSSAELNSSLRDRVVAHETMHVLGLDHDAEDWSQSPDEVMNPVLSWNGVAFGQGDLEGLKYLRNYNRCAPQAVAATVSRPAAKPSTAASAPGAAKPATTTTATTTTATTTTATTTTATTTAASAQANGKPSSRPKPKPKPKPSERPPTAPTPAPTAPAPAPAPSVAPTPAPGGGQQASPSTPSAPGQQASPSTPSAPGQQAKPSTPNASVPQAKPSTRPTPAPTAAPAPAPSAAPAPAPAPAPAAAPVAPKPAAPAAHEDDDDEHENEGNHSSCKNRSDRQIPGIDC